MLGANIPTLSLSNPRILKLVDAVAKIKKVVVENVRIGLRFNVAALQIQSRRREVGKRKQKQSGSLIRQLTIQKPNEEIQQCSDFKANQCINKSRQSRRPDT